MTIDFDNSAQQDSLHGVGKKCSFTARKDCKKCNRANILPKKQFFNFSYRTFASACNANAAAMAEENYFTGINAILMWIVIIGWIANKIQHCIDTIDRLIEAIDKREERRD